MTEERSTGELLESLQQAARELIVSHLRTRAVSLSSHENRRTGNAYQAVRLGDELLRGFRSGQRNIFAGVQLERKKVLDLGCNLGEVTRDAIRAGAALARGIEYDAFFVQLARYIAAFNGMSRVFYQQGDLTRRETYAGIYDIVLALSVFPYVEPWLKRIAAMTRELLIVETHAVDENWRKVYLEPLKKLFPHVALVGISDHKAAGSTDARYLLFCARTPLYGTIHGRARALRNATGLLSIDLTRSAIRHYDQFLAAVGADRTSSLDEISDAAHRHRASQSDDAVFAEVQQLGLVESPLYWCHYLDGYREYLHAGTLDRENTYYKAVKEIHARGLREGFALAGLLKRPDGGLPRLALRYEMLRELEAHPDGSTLDPVIIYSTVSSAGLAGHDRVFRLHVNELQERAHPLTLDGYHRMFAGYVRGATRLRVMPVWYDEIPMVRAFIDEDPERETAIWDGVYDLSSRLGRIAAAAASDTPARPSAKQPARASRASAKNRR